MARSLRDRRGGARLRAVALIGIDGSGKTTQAHHLAEALTAAGRPATYHRNAGGRRWLGRVAQRFGRPDAERLVGRRGLLAVESVLRWLAIAAALLSCLVTGRTAVMDRYSACQYASIRAHGGQRWERLARVGYRLFPPPQVTFLLAVDPAEAYQRIERRGTDHETMGWLTAADRAYRTLPEFPSFVVVDAGRPPEEVSRQIRAHLAAWLPAQGVTSAGAAAPAGPSPAEPAPAAPPAQPAPPAPAGAPGAVALPVDDAGRGPGLLVAGQA
ncbi:dTMP kinase [Micromonospora carbonacea]|uniref:dTMP kinase n=1 Tax=Micromonospora carbonacea TaxID=47853 RepID=UPI0018351028|nr:dTMP kinase [Micromonospora carbonacea]MBB5824684.1 dTMP kinase [Micromonospora carbonacea]